MTRDILLGIDAGTSVIKAVAFSLGGEQIAVAARPNVYQTLGGGQVEQDMHRTWADCAATLRELGDRVPDLARRVVALAVTAQGDGTWLIDADGEPVGGGLLWLDSRAASLASDYLKTDAYREHYARTGSGLNACMASAQLAWMKRWQPDRIARAATCFHCKDWLYFKLTGARVTDPAEGNFTFGNYRTREYEPSILEGMEIGDCWRLLPPMIDGVSETGKLSAGAAAETLLPEGLPVSLAYLDVVCTALGGGLCDPAAEVGVSVVGSTGMHMRYAATPDDVRPQRGPLGLHDVPAGRTRLLFDAVQHGGHSQYRLADGHGSRSRGNGGRQDEFARRFSLASTRECLGPTPAKRCIIPTFSKLASAVLSSILTRGRSSAASRRRRALPVSRDRSLKASLSRREIATSLPARFPVKSDWAEARRGRRRCAPFSPRCSTRMCGR